MPIMRNFFCSVKNIQWPIALWSCVPLYIMIHSSFISAQCTWYEWKNWFILYTFNHAYVGHVVVCSDERAFRHLRENGNPIFVGLCFFSRCLPRINRCTGAWLALVNQIKLPRDRNSTLYTSATAESKSDSHSLKHVLLRVAYSHLYNYNSLSTGSMWLEAVAFSKTSATFSWCAGVI